MMPAASSVTAVTLYFLHLLSGADSACCVHGTTALVAGKSCHDILFWSPACSGVSGLYWVHNSSSGADEQVWCDMETLGGGWEKVVDFQASTTVPVCPYTLSAHPFNGSFLCSNSGEVIEATIRVTSDSFSELQGSVSAFAAGDFQSFLPSFSAEQSRNLNGHFLDGISVLLREDSSPELRHVHSFVIGNYENIDNVFMQQVTCPGFGAAVPNAVIGNHYTCALLKLDNHLSNGQPLPVWEMSSVYCNNVDGMCTRPSDWFYRRIGKQYTSNSTEIVVKFMSQSSAYIALKHLTLYVR